MEKPKTLEELRKNLVSTVASLDLEMGGDGRDEDAAKEVAEFEKAVRADEEEKIEKPMTEVEELQALIVRDAGWFPVCIPLVKERLTALISAAEKQGEETYRAFIENNDTRRAAIATLSRQSQVAREIGRREGLEQGKAEGEERLQKYTEEYLKEGIRRCTAALAQGKAEGAGQTKQWIRNTQDFIAQGDEVSCTDVHYATCVDNTEQDFAEAQVDLYVVPASILAPKEKP